jgi:predicted site-specific integrase-resolvase
MPNGNLQKTSSELNVPTYLPLSDAARKFSLSEKALTQLVKTGKIEAVQLPSGELLVAAEYNGGKPLTKQEIISERFSHLRGKTINAYAAQKEYGIRYQNFIKWARSGYIEIIHEDEGRLVEMDAADVAYCAYMYKRKKAEYDGNIAGVRIFDDDGNPYRLKYPDLSAKRRE